jgi:hypothetical protein
VGQDFILKFGLKMAASAHLLSGRRFHEVQIAARCGEQRSYSSALH